MEAESPVVAVGAGLGRTDVRLGDGSGVLGVELGCIDVRLGFGDGLPGVGLGVVGVGVVGV